MLTSPSLRRRQGKKLLNWYWPARCAEHRKCLAFIQQWGSDFSQAQCSKHASTRASLSMNTKPFRAIPMSFQMVFLFFLITSVMKGCVQRGSVSLTSLMWNVKKQPKQDSPQNKLPPSLPTLFLTEGQSCKQSSTFSAWWNILSSDPSKHFLLLLN